MSIKLCKCGMPIHSVAGKWEHLLPPYVYCVRRPGKKAEPR